MRKKGVISYSNQGSIFFDSSSDCFHYLARKKEVIYLVKEVSVEEVVDEFNHIPDGKLIIFCGAGISVSSPSYLPLFSDYQEAIISEMKELLPETHKGFLEKEINIVKSGRYPTEFFMQKLYNYWGKKAIHLTHFFGEQKFHANENHKIIASLVRSRRISIILTTNFDKLLEREIGEKNVEIFEGKDVSQTLALNISDRNLETPLIIKLHGSAGNDKSIILTLNQEGKAQESFCDLIASITEKRTLLFLGYSGRDLDLMPILLGKQNKAQKIYWVFYPPTYDEEIETENRLVNSFGDRVQSVICNSADFLRMIISKEEQNEIHSDDPKNNPLKWRSFIKEAIQAINKQNKNFDAHRTLMIFFELAWQINERDAAKKFLESAWPTYKNVKDNSGLAMVADAFSIIYRNELATNRSSIKVLTKVKYWMRQSQKYAKRSNDNFIKGMIANSNATWIFEHKRDAEFAENQFKIAKEYYSDYYPEYEKNNDISKFEKQARREYIDLLVARINYNIGRCYRESCKDKAVQVFNEQKVGLRGTTSDDLRVAMAIKDSIVERIGYAMKYLNEAESNFLEIGALWDVAEVKMEIGACINYLGQFDGVFRYEEAMREFKEALDKYESINDEVGQAQAHLSIGETYYHLKKREEKIRHLIEAKRLFTKLKMTKAIQICEELMNREMESPGYLEAIRVCKKLEQAGKSYDLASCLTARKSLEQGEAKLSEGDFKGALKYAIEAELIFTRIPEARYLLAICKTVISTAYGGLRNHERVAWYASEAIALVAGNEMLVFTEGSAYMNLGMAQVNLNQPDQALSNLEIARRILRNTQDGAQYIPTIEYNIRLVKPSGCMVAMIFIIVAFLTAVYLSL